jgi:ATP-dependent RNA helicase SUPV3L1/SUV3
VPGAEHTACTVEMVSMSRRVDAAVIDEIQMIGDDCRCAPDLHLFCSGLLHLACSELPCVCVELVAR